MAPPPCGPGSSRRREALSLARQVNDKIGLGWGLWALGLVGRNAGNYHQAATRFDEALATFREIAENSGISASIGELGWVRWLQGDVVGPLVLLRQSLAVPPNRHGIAERLARKACVLAGQGRLRRVTVLLARADAERDAMDLVWEPAERACIDQALGATQAGLDASDRRAARAEGPGMTLDQGVAYALEPMEMLP